MKKGMIKASVLFAVFITSVVIISIIMNQGSDDITAKMSEAEFPVLYIKQDGDKINCIHAYADSMKAANVRDTITPVEADGNIELLFDYCQTEVKNISYELTTLDMSGKISKSNIDNWKIEDNQIDVNISIGELPHSQTEYSLAVKLETENDEMWYYTRVIQDDDTAVKALKFAKKFHNDTISKGAQEDIIPYVESDPAADNSSYENITINSSYDMITWNDLDVSVVEEPVFDFSEINSSYESMTARYIVEIAGENTKKQYEVEEFFRVKVVTGAYYLLDYNRTMEQIFDVDAEFVTNSYINLGISGTDVEFKQNDSGTIVSFVKNGELYCYNISSAKIAKVFGFSSSTEYDPREDYNQHDIKIIKVDEMGNTFFAVSGYMNRGNHEGQTGIAVYHYDNETNTVEEAAFIKSDKSYQLLKEAEGELVYVSDDDNLYMLFGGSVYKVSLGTREVTHIIKGLKEDGYVISNDNSIIAWQQGDKYNSKNIKVHNLNNDEEYTISASDDERIYPIGFIDQDFIYGTANYSDITNTSVGTIIFPMKNIIITDKEKIIKKYNQKGYYVTDAEVEGSRIVLTRATKNEDGSFAEAAEDNIVNSTDVEEEIMEASYIIDDTFKMEKCITVPSEIDDTSLTLLTPEEVLYEESREVDIDNSRGDKQYDIYSRQKIVYTTDSISKAIIKAQENSGVVVDSNMKYIWQKGAKESESDLDGYTLENAVSTDSITACLEMIMAKENKKIDVADAVQKGSTVMDILSNNLEYTVLDLTGCELDSVLYFIAKGSPVIAMKNANNAVLITQYDIYNITVTDPSSRTKYKISLDDSKELFTNVGNIFITYIK